MLGRSVHSKINDFCLQTSDILDEGFREMWQEDFNKSCGLQSAVSPGEFVLM
jgi:hypothetical protein